MDIKRLRQRAAALKGDLARLKKERAAVGEAAVRDGRAMTEEERATFVSLGPQIELLETQLAENGELLQAAEASLEAEKLYRAVDEDPDVTAATQSARSIQVIDPSTRPGYWGAQLHAVRNYAINGGWAHLGAEDRALLQPMLATATGANTDTPSEGGFLVGTQRAGGILQRAYEVGELLSRVARQPIGPGSNGLKINAIDETSRADSSRYGGIVSGWLGQGNTLTSGKPKFREMDLKLKKVGAFVYATEEMQVDPIAFEAWVNRYLPLELTFRVENAIINGTGSGQPLGLLNSGALISITRNTASHVLYDDVRAMWARMWAPLRAEAVWLIDQTVEAELEVMSIVIGTAGVLAPIYKAAGTLPGQVYATLYGRPVIPVEHCAVLGTSGDIVLANLGEYTLIDKGGVDQAVSLHVAFLTDESVYRFTYRVDGQLSWSAALTPKSGGSSLTCAVVLS